MSTNNLLLEIGTEEIPSGYFDHLLSILSSADDGVVKTCFDAHGINIGKVSSYSTPRRIILYVEDIPIAQDLKIEGPPKRIAYDEDDRPTKALEAFLNKNSASIKDVTISSGEKGDRVVVNKRDVSNIEALKEILPKIIKSLDFPKTMRWDEEGYLFARPIRWILALFGSDIVDFSVGAIQSSGITHGHRFLGRSKIKVNSSDSYFKVLSKNHVTWDNEVRKQKLLAFLEKKRWHENPELLDEVNNLIESPFFIEGVFKIEYLSLPKEVLLASMSKHQRIFCLKDKQGNLANKFVAVLNGNYRGRKNIQKHYEEVLDARLKDALFFYESDTKRPLAKWAEGLKDVVFHKELGTLSEKVQRLKEISGFLTKYIKIDSEEKKALARVAMLCKADLLTQMVREFPSLQGVVGSYYAADSGEGEDVSEAIKEHYLPRFGDDEVPQSRLGMLCSLADKTDNIVSYFKIGKFPKGSWDLYALRRQAIGVVSILIKNDLHLPISDLINYAYEITPGGPGKNQVKGALLDFFRERFISFVKERYGYRYDLIDSVTAEGEFDDIAICFLKLESLNSIIDESCFESARSIVERSYNIIKSQKSLTSDVKSSMLKEPQEQLLYDKLNNLEEDFKQLCVEGSYEDATKLYSDRLFHDLHNFFDKVMVNVEDKSLRLNRIALLSRVNSLYVNNIADLSKIVVNSE